MYSLSDKQIDYILSDISARGVETEDLQYNLLDHVCCIIERELGEKEDFEQFYRRTISRFYNRELRELEEETQLLLTFKNYYTMKKTMIIGGFSSAIMLLFGGFFKIMHWPGANMLLILGTALFTFLFLPLMFTLKLREKKEKRERTVLVFGMIVSIILIIGALFKMMHWPGASVISLGALGVLIFLFVPVYLITGLRNPDTKVNTVVTSILIIAGCAFLLVLPNRGASKVLSDITVLQLLNEENILDQMKAKVLFDSANASNEKVYISLMKSADALKDAVARSISEVDYRSYLSKNEGISPAWLMPEQYREMPERLNYIRAMQSFEQQTGIKLYEYGAGGMNSVQDLDQALLLQPHVKDIMEFITATQNKAVISMMK